MHTYSICFQLFPFKHRLIADKTVSFKILQLRFACLPTPALAAGTGKISVHLRHIDFDGRFEFPCGLGNLLGCEQVQYMGGYCARAASHCHVPAPGLPLRTAEKRDDPDHPLGPCRSIGPGNGTLELRADRSRLRLDGRCPGAGSGGRKRRISGRGKRLVLPALRPLLHPPPAGLVRIKRKIG